MTAEQLAEERAQAAARARADAAAWDRRARQLEAALPRCAGCGEPVGGGEHQVRFLVPGGAPVAHTECVTVDVLVAVGVSGGGR